MLSVASMFFSRRSTQAEYYDADRPQAEVTEFLRTLNLVNGLFDFAEPFKRMLPGFAPGRDPRALTILDLGAANGHLGDVLTRWASQRGWEWQVTDLDLKPGCLALGKGPRRVVGSVLNLPFANESFDVVIASQMAHHLDNANVVVHLREAWRVARHAMVVSDLHRNPLLYCFLWGVCRLFRFPKTFRGDALLSVRRGWRVGELRDLARQAGIPEPRLERYFGARVNLWSRKQV